MENKSKLERYQMINFCADLRREGRSWEDIAKHLKDRGYTNPEGKPYHMADICSSVIHSHEDLRKYKKHKLS